MAYMLCGFSCGRRKIMVNGKNKGGNFERKVAKQLSEWGGVEFHRTPMSGALHWDGDTRVISDIVPPQGLVWPFSIECKKVEYDWSFSNFIEGTSLFWEHWKQAYGDAEREGLIPLLVFSKNYRNTYAAMTVDVFLVLFNKKKKPNYITVKCDKSCSKHDIIILDFNEFLSHNSLEEIQRLGNI